MQVMPLFCLAVLGFHDFLYKMTLRKSCAAPEFFADMCAASGLPHDKRLAALLAGEDRNRNTPDTLTGNTPVGTLTDHGLSLIHI